MYFFQFVLLGVPKGPLDGDLEATPKKIPLWYEKDLSRETLQFTTKPPLFVGQCEVYNFLPKLIHKRCHVASFANH